MHTRITIRHAESRVGTIGFPSKMPGTSFGIPARHCATGSKLHDVADSVCSRCYALNGNYMFKSTLASQENRFQLLGNAEWRDSMVFLLRRYHGLLDGAIHHKIEPDGAGWHRWHDSGDVQSEAHLDDIVAVCEATPEIKHWLPTKEIALLARWLKARHGVGLERINDVLPANLCIRVSGSMIDGPATVRAPNTSTVHRHTAPTEADRCTAPDTDGKCATCRKCWDKTHHNTGYHLHG